MFRYERILQDSQTPQTLKADIFKQLGWMHHVVEELGEKVHRQNYALTSLKSSIEADGSSGQSLYFLGRCYAGYDLLLDRRVGCLLTGDNLSYF